MSQNSRSMRWGNSSRSSSNHSQTASSQKLPEPSRDQRKLPATPWSAKTRELSILRGAPEQQLCRTAVLCARTVSLWKQLRPNPGIRIDSRCSLALLEAIRAHEKLPGMPRSAQTSTCRQSSSFVGAVLIAGAVILCARAVALDATRTTPGN